MVAKTQVNQTDDTIVLSWKRVQVDGKKSISSLYILFCWTPNDYGIGKPGKTYRKRGVRKAYLQCSALGEKNH